MTALLSRLCWIVTLAVPWQGGCLAPDAHFPVAVGARGMIPSVHGPCNAEGNPYPRALRIEEDSEVYTASECGQVRLECRDGGVEFDIRVATRAEIVGPKTVRMGQNVRYEARILDWEGQELLVGEFGDVEWTVPSGALEVLGPCKPGAKLCQTMTAAAPGPTTVSFKFGTLTAQQSVQVN